MAALWLEHRTLSRDNPRSNLLAAVSKNFVSIHVSSVHSPVRMTIDNSGYMKEKASLSNCNNADCFPEEHSALGSCAAAAVAAAAITTTTYVIIIIIME